MVLASTPARPFGAVLTAMVTPMTPGGEVDLDAAATVATYLVDHGSDGLVLNGTTGESPTTHAPEKAELVRVVADAVGDRAAVVAGAGSNDTEHAVRMAQQAQEAGADGLLVVSPYYSRPSQEGLLRHFAAVADSTDLPVMLYDVPGRTGVRVAPDTYARIAEHERVVATKDATGDVASAALLTARTGLAWYSGDDGLLLPFLVHGGAGVVSVAAHAVGDTFAAAVAAYDAGDLARALDLVRAAAPAVAALNGAGFQAVMAKASLEVLGVLGNRHVRLPLVPATDDEVVGVRAGLDAAREAADALLGATRAVPAP